ncbi:MAG: hypothetical protein Q9163_005297 [Psora crenata]
MDRRSIGSLHSTRQSARSLDTDIFSDEHALQRLELDNGPQRAWSLGEHDLSPPHCVDDQTPQSSTSAAQEPPNMHIGSTTTSDGSHRTTRQNSTSSRSSHSRSLTSASDSYTTPTLRRSTMSSVVVPRAQSPYQGATGPTHPYAMYSQDISVTRTPSMATTSTLRRPEMSYSGPVGPTQPYGMYPQHTVSGDDQDPFNESTHAVTAANLPGSRPAPRLYRRRLGANGEDVDDLLGPDGYTEQLPPYTRYPNNVPPKGGTDAVSVVNDPAPDQQAATRQPESSGETLPHRSRSGNDDTAVSDDTATLPLHNPFMDGSTQVSSTTAIDESPKMEVGWFSQRAKARSKKRICGGVMPCWLLVLVLVVVVLAGLIGGIIGGVLARTHGVDKGLNAMPDEVPASPVATTATVTTTSPAQTPDDAVPLAPTPTNLPPIPTGTFAVILNNPSTTTNSCLADASQNNAWDCSTGASLSVVVKLPAAGENRAPVIAISYPPPKATIQYGAQPPQLGGYTILSLMKDKSAFHKGPAYAFMQQYNKTVVVKEGDLPGGIPNSKRDPANSLRRWLGGALDRDHWESFFKRQQSDWTQREFAQPGDRPWYCFWNGTTLTGFIYVTQDLDSDVEAAATSGLSKRQEPSAPPQYPKQIKIEERQDPYNPSLPYCQQFQVLYNYQLNPVNRDNGTPNVVNLAESEQLDPNQAQVQKSDKDEDGAGAQGRAQQSQKRDQGNSSMPDATCQPGSKDNLRLATLTLHSIFITRMMLQAAKLLHSDVLHKDLKRGGAPQEFADGRSHLDSRRQSRFSRISCYISVPPPRVPQDASSNNKSEQSTFAISITLLTPGLNVPYSAPKPTPVNPYPQPRKVGGLPSNTGERGRYASAIEPYLPLTVSSNETVAAYIYFDGRPKEEVATLLRRGEETWVNSRWVSMPDSEGGGLAEREFLFREVGLERWLNGLDLDGKDTAAKIERRRQKVDSKRRRRRKIKSEGTDDEEGGSSVSGRKHTAEKEVLKHGADARSPLEQMSDFDAIFLSGTEESDDDPIPESTGQIKVALYRVFASGEIRRGEYSPQFDAHEGDDDIQRMDVNGGDGSTGKEGQTEEVDHTTSFAKPKTLDPKTISTQTVTGIDPQDSPFAVFTFLYRGEKQLQKMGILSAAPRVQQRTSATNSKRRSLQDDFSKFKPLNSTTLMNFSTMRDPSELNGGEEKHKVGKRQQPYTDSDEDPDREDEILVKAEDAESKDADVMLSPEDARRQGELAEGFQKIRLKRQHSADLLSAPSAAPASRKTPPEANTPVKGLTPPISGPASADVASPAPSAGPLLPSVAFDKGMATETIGSPLKKARSSLSGVDDKDMRKRFGLGLSGVKADVLGAIEHDRMAGSTNGESASNEVAPATRAGFGLQGGLLGGVVGDAATNGQVQHVQPKEVKSENMEDEEL